MSEGFYDEQVDLNLSPEAVDSIEQAAARGTETAVGNYVAQQQAVQQAQLAQAQQQLASASAAQADAEMQKRYPGGEWDHDKAEVARRIGQKPGLISESSFFDPSALANDLDTAYQVAQVETKAEAEQARKRADDDFFAGVQKAHQKTWSQRMAEGGQSVHDVLEGDAS